MDFKGRYIPRTAASEAYDSQYMKRAERNINKLNAVHVIWTVTSTMKGELDDEMESKGLMKGNTSAGAGTGRRSTASTAAPSGKCSSRRTSRASPRRTRTSMRS